MKSIVAIPKIVAWVQQRSQISQDNTNPQMALRKSLCHELSIFSQAEWMNECLHSIKS